MSLFNVRTLVAAVAAGSALLTCAAAPPATGAGAATGLVEVAVGSYNIRAGVSTEAFRAAVTEFVPRVQVAGLQEVSSKEKEAVLASLDGWDYFRADRYEGEQNPVIWNRAVFALESARTVRVADATYVANEVPGKSGHIKPQYVTVVRLRHLLTGQNVSVINLHLVPGAVKAGQRWPDRPRLFQLYVGELARVVELTKAERAWGQVFVLGDFNVGWVADERHRKRRLPFRKFKGMGMPSMWATERPGKRGTHNDALIDQVYTSEAATDASVAFDIDESDHWPAIARYELDLPVPLPS